MMRTSRGWLDTSAAPSQARQAAEEPLLRRLWHRLPWLADRPRGCDARGGDLRRRFEADLEENVLLAIFIPAVVYMADAVGTQTETVLIRGMAAGVDLRVVVLRGEQAPARSSGCCWPRSSSRSRGSCGATGR